MPSIPLASFPTPLPGRRSLAVTVFCCLLALAPKALPADAPTPDNRWAHITTALFCTSQDVDKLLTKPEDRAAALAYFAPLKLSKFYLENGSGDPAVVPILREIAAALRSQGYEVSGAVVPSNRGPLCYNDPKDMALLEAKVKVLAQVFDEIIVDDWLFTTCTCATCVEERGSQSWADYRSRLVAEQSKIHLIDAARQVRPGIKVIIKYPNWYEGHRQNGYDVARQTPQFDGVSVGIETRQPTTQDQHIPTYSGYVIQKWIGGNAGAKWRSAWLDNYQMEGADDDFVAEVGQAVLARAPEIIFWCAGVLHPPRASASNYPHLTAMMPEFDRLAGLLEGPSRGIPMHMPIGSVGEYNIFGYLGMIGLPIDPRESVPEDTKTAIFTKHSLADPKIAVEILARMRAGKEVFLTWPLLQALRQSELGNVLNVISEGGTVSSPIFRTHDGLWETKPIDAGRPFTFPRIELSTWPYARDVGLVREDADFGILMRSPYLGGHVDVLNLPDNTYDLQRLPEQVLDAIRLCFFDELGVRLMGPGGVALYPFGSRQYVLYNMNEAPAKVSLRLPKTAPTSGWKETMGGKDLAATPVDGGQGPWARHEIDVALTLKPFEIAVVEAP